MVVDYSALTPGQEVSRHSYRLDADTVATYVDAVDDRSRDWMATDRDGFVPPMAIAALAFKGLIRDLAIPGGAVHGGQELEFKGAVRLGDTLACRAGVLQNSVRRGWRFLVLGLAVEDAGEREVMTGKSTIMLPVTP